MLAALPAPVLSVTADAVKELDGREALSSLWTLFTKCKESLQDGHRLENISWRLWYRELMLNTLDSQNFDRTQSEGESTGDIIDTVGQDEKSPQYLVLSEVEPFLPSKLEADGAVPSLTSNDTPPPHLGNPMSAPTLLPTSSPAPLHSFLASQPRRPSVSARSRRSSFLVGATPISVGKIIYDMLPTSPAPPALTGPSLSGSLKASDELSKHGIARLSISGLGRSRESSTTFSEANVIAQPNPHASNHNSLSSSSVTTMATTPIPDGTRPELSMKCTLPDSPTFKSYLPTPEKEIDELGSPAGATESSIPSKADFKSEPAPIPPSTSSMPNKSIPPKLQSVASVSHPTLIYSGPPSPSLSDSYACAHPAEVEIKEVGLMASLSPTNTKDHRLGPISESSNVSSASQLLQLSQLSHQPPQLIVVDPTPNPTPHPTPPATPLLSGDAVKRSHFLTLPLSGTNHVLRKRQSQQSPLHTLSDDPEFDHDRSRITSIVPDGHSTRNEEGHDRSTHTQDEEDEGNRQLSPTQGLQHEIPPRNANRNSISSITSSNHSHTTNTTTSSRYSRVSSTTDTSVADADSGADTDHKPVLTTMPNALLSRVAGSASTLTLQHTNHTDSRFGSRRQSSEASTSYYVESQASRICNHNTSPFEDDDSPSSPLPPLASPLQSPKKKKRNSAPATAVEISTMNGQPVASSSFVASPNSISSTQTGSVPSCANVKRRSSAVTGCGAMARRTSSGRNSSRSRSTGGSSTGIGVGKSKNRNYSRDPPNKALCMTVVGGVKKTSVVANGKGRPKFQLGRANAAKASRNAAMKRENSVGLLDGVARELSQQLEDNLKQGKAWVGDQELEAETRRQEMKRKQHEQEEQMEEARLETQLKERAEEAMREMVRQRQAEVQKQEEKQKQQELIAQADDARRPVRFNIGSNSDEAKSAGSGSEFSGGRSAQEAPVSNVATGGLLASLAKGKERAVEAPLAEPSQQAFLQQSQRQMSKQQLQQLQKLAEQYAKHPSIQQQPSAKEKSNERGKVEEGSHKCREKGKQKDSSAGASTGKSGRHTNGAVDPDLVAKVNQSLGSPLLPQNKRTIVLATSESDFETDSDDDGSWSSEEIGADDIEQRRKQPDAAAQKRQEAEHQQLLYQQQQEQQRKLQEQQQVQRRQQSTVRPPAVQRTHSSHYPTTNHHRTKQNARSQQQRQALSNTQALVEQAALEAQRQRDMFAKLPTESFQDLAKARTQSVGLLTQLMNPNPEIFPPNHPYRRGFSSGEVRPVAGMSSIAPIQPLTKHGQSQPHVPSNPPQTTVPPKKFNPPSVRSTLSPPGRPSFMQLTKKAPVQPVSSQVAVGSMHSKTGVVAGVTDTVANVKNSQLSSSGYRPRGPPKDQELEDESDTDNDPGFQVSKSVAQERLKAYAERRNIQPNHNPVSPPLETSVAHREVNDVPEWARVSQPRHNRSQSQGQDPQRRSLNGLHSTQTPAQDGHPLAAPIPFGHPYNLPHPAPPSTPRTTRRLMLSTELSESLRRNLLWERQVSKANLSAVRRTASGGGGRHSILHRLQPLTAAPSMVQLLPKGTTQPEGSNHRTASDRDRRASGGAVNNQQDRETMQQQAMARNRSWADDYHFKGW